ncbi:MAG: PilZ domain-containing protein [Vicinamibacteria bacterium]|nr:PilZ domain-containing protein [Vicinamibacteria bacterium]
MYSTDRYVLDDARAWYSEAPAPIANISVGGMFVCTPIPPMQGTAVALKLALGSRPAFVVAGVVIWTNEGKERRAPHLPAGFGFQIRKVAMEDKLHIVNHLKQAARGGAKLARPRSPSRGKDAS